MISAEGSYQQFVNTLRAIDLIVFVLNALDGEEVLQGELELGEMLRLAMRVEEPKCGVNERLRLPRYVLVPDEVVRHSRTSFTSILKHRERNRDHVGILGVDCRAHDIAEIPCGGVMLQPTLSVEGNCFRKAPLKFLDGREFDTTNANALCLRSLHGERGRNSEMIFLAMF